MSMSIAGINVSPPSNENLFCPTNFVCRKFSKKTASFNFCKMFFFSSMEKSGMLRDFSIRFCNQSTTSG